MGLGLLLVLFLQGCSEDSHSMQTVASGDLTASGSSTVYPLTREAVRRFERANPDVNIAVEFTGTTAGFKKFCAGEADINNASRPINESEQAVCESNDIAYVEVPIAMDAISIVVHPSNNWANDITVDELHRLWLPASEGEVMTWRDVRESWPDEPIELFGRGQDSGTYDYFTTAILGTTRSSRTDYVASEDEEFLAAQIAAEPGALGFFGIGGYHRHWNELKLLAVTNGDHSVFPTLETVKRGEYTPLSRPLYLYLNQQSLKEKPALHRFAIAYVEGIRDWIHFTGYLPLEEQVYADTLDTLHLLEGQ
ncbi:ABC transporter substrate-binding protein [Halomonas sp. 'Soap Lake |nr:ABC transporter substrate-binding protein [Halomonas sp. 'Soap Lake \